MTLLHASLGLLVAVIAGVLVVATVAVAAGDAEALVDSMARLRPGWRRN